MTNDINPVELVRAANDGDGFGGGNGWWIILLFLFLGWGNGDPQFRHIERPGRASGTPARDPQTLTIYPFVGRAQLIVRSIEGSAGPVSVSVGPVSLNF